MTSTNPGNYLGNIVSAVAGREGFDPTHPDSPALIRYSVITLILYLVFILVFSYGAAKLSYAYNVSIGTSSGMTTLYSVLSFFLSSLYYPYYAIFLNPVGQKKGKNSGKN